MSTIRIKNTQYELSPRIAKDVLDLSSIITSTIENSNNTVASELIIKSKIVCDSLIASKRYYKPWQFKYWRLNKFRGNKGVLYLLNKCSVETISTAFENVLELEGLKKKENQESQ